MDRREPAGKDSGRTERGRECRADAATGEELMTFLYSRCLGRRTFVPMMLRSCLASLGATRASADRIKRDVHPREAA